MVQIKCEVIRHTPFMKGHVVEGFDVHGRWVKGIVTQIAPFADQPLIVKSLFVGRTIIHQFQAVDVTYEGMQRLGSTVQYRHYAVNA